MTQEHVGRVLSDPPRSGLLVIAILLIAMPAFAHHSFTAEYDVNQPITLKGTLSKMEWVNPHGWIHIDVRGPDGKVVTWAVETGSTNALLKSGLRRTDFPPGAALVIQGYRAKDGTNTANGRTVTTPDGRNFFTGADSAPKPY